MVAPSIASSSFNGSASSSQSSAAKQGRTDKEQQEGQQEELVDRTSSFENGVFGVLVTLVKENSETHIRIRWVLLKVFLDTWQLFTTVVLPAEQGWDIDSNGTVWSVVSVFNFRWLHSLGYNVYLFALYGVAAALVLALALGVWVSGYFKERKFPLRWPIKLLWLIRTLGFQTFDVACLHLLQLGISCNYTGALRPHMHLNLFPQYSCAKAPHILHAIVSGLCLVLFVAIALLLNMAEVEVNPKSRRPLALGHSGAEVAAFAIKALLTLVNVFFGWRRVAACFYLALSLALAYQYLRWSPHLVAWVNYLKTGVSTTVVWCAATLMLLVFEPGVKQQGRDSWSKLMTIVMLSGLAPAFGAGMLLSRIMIRRMTSTTLKCLKNMRPSDRLEDVVENITDPRDVEIVARCCRVGLDPAGFLDPGVMERAAQVIKAGLAMFPTSAYMVLLHANFMIDVLGVSQSGSRRVQDARRLEPSLMCRFIMFVRQQSQTHKDNNSQGATMDMLSYVEYQRKQRIVLRLHREALQAMCNFWRYLDTSNISFRQLSKALAKIEASVYQAQKAYRVVLDDYSSSPKLLRLYAKFLQGVKSDPWGAVQYFEAAEKLEEKTDNDAGGPLLPDGTPLGRMDEMDVAVLVVNAAGEIQMANRQTHNMFGYKRGNLEGKHLSSLLAPHFSGRLSEQIQMMVCAGDASVVAGGAGGGGGSSSEGSHQGAVRELEMLGMHCDRLAFPVKLSLRKASGVGEDSAIIAMLEPAASPKSVASLWVAPTGTIAACDPRFVANFGWRASEVYGANVGALITIRFPGVQAGKATDLELGGHAFFPDDEEAEHADDYMDSMPKLLAWAKAARQDGSFRAGLQCVIAHKYDSSPLMCSLTVVEDASAGVPIHEVRIRLLSSTVDHRQILAVDRKGALVHASPELVTSLIDTLGCAPLTG
ncbi:hypothetical protein Agub_g7932, partial [Astrephomene gubernaculifera]